MRIPTLDAVEKARVNRPPSTWTKGEPYGIFFFPLRAGQVKGGTQSVLLVIASGADPEVYRANLPGYTGPLFEHVSVSVVREARCPTWAEMCFVKDMFWSSEETVIQYHPPESAYVHCRKAFNPATGKEENLHEYVLHLWRIVGFEIPLPPSELI